MVHRKNLFPLTIAVLMLAALPLLSSCSKKPKPTPTQIVDNQAVATREAIDKYVQDDARANQLLDLFSELQGVLKEYKRGLEGMTGDFREAYNDYESSREQLEQLTDQIKESTRKTRGKILDLHFKMRDLTTEDEWKKIVKYEADAITASRSVSAGEGGSDGSY